MHIELTSRCILACPACPRTWFSETFNRPFPKQDLDLDSLVNFLDCESGSKITKFLINGNHGDPIYYPRLFEFIDTFRDTKRFLFSTAASHQPEKFWKDFARRLTPADIVYFSIDGLEHNNHLYRRNSDWKSIMTAVDVMRYECSAQLVWKTLVFSYNQNEIDQIQEFAESKGFLFFADTTSRFGDESLRPNEQFVDVERLYEKNQDTVVIDPRCFKDEYVSAEGYYWPCCFISSYYTLHKTSLWKNRHDWAIAGRTLDQLHVNLSQWQKEILQDPENAHPICKMSCKPGQTFGWPYS